MHKGIRMVILIVNSSVAIIDRLVEMLSGKKKIRLILTASSFAVAAALYAEHKPAAILLDMDLPGNAAIRLLQVLKSQENESPVVMMYIIEDNHKMEQCRLLGADFFCDLYHQYENIPGIVDCLAENKKILM